MANLEFYDTFSPYFDRSDAKPVTKSSVEAERVRPQPEHLTTVARSNLRRATHGTPRRPLPTTKQ